MTTDFEGPREETEGSRAPSTGARADAALSLTHSLYRLGHAEEISVPVPAGTIAIADVYPDVATGLSAVGLEAVRRALLLPVVRVEQGRCEVTACGEVVEARGLLGAVVIDGLLVDELRLGGHVSAQICGPGDLVSGDHGLDGVLATTHALQAPIPSSLAILDDRFGDAVRRWPRLAAEFFSQAMRQVDRTGEHRAICQLTRVEDRLLTLFWYLADRWGRVHADGVTIELPLTHEIIGRLIGARRPTVTLGLRELARQDLLRREPGGRWRLATESLQRVNAAGREDGWYRSRVGVAS